jgi:hypothetical protein
MTASDVIPALTYTHKLRSSTPSSTLIDSMLTPRPRPWLSAFLMFDLVTRSRSGATLREVTQGSHDSDSGALIIRFLSL